MLVEEEMREFNDEYFARVNEMFGVREKYAGTGIKFGELKRAMVSGDYKYLSKGGIRFVSNLLGEEPKSDAIEGKDFNIDDLTILIPEGIYEKIRNLKGNENIRTF